MYYLDSYEISINRQLEKVLDESFALDCSDDDFSSMLAETVESFLVGLMIEKKSRKKRKSAVSGLERRKLTQEIIDKYKSSDNLLIHMQDDVDGIAYFKKRTLVGYVGYSGEWIKGIWVHPKYRELHLGSRLLKYAVKHGAVKSSVNKSNEVSLLFHEKNGFKKYRSDKNMVYLKFVK